ncbi:SLBB domain-containing protein [bacterium]|nr:SLBB domain-containing protein [bacterium]
MKNLMVNDISACVIKGLRCLFIVGILVLNGTVSAQETAPVTPNVPAGDNSFNTQDIMKTYMINPLDRLLIVVYAGEKQTTELEKYVQSDGSVYLPFIEQDVVLGGLMVLEAQKKLEELARTYIKEPRVVITVMSSYSQTVSTYGKIANRNFELNAPMRILQLIARAGGPLENAHEDSIRVISRDGTIRFFNFRKVNLNPTNETNFLLKPGDIVYVPGIEDFSVIVFGDIRTAGVYKMRQGERLLDALVKAGSWTAQADLKNVRIIRVNKGKKAQVMEVDLKNIFNKGNTQLNYQLRDGDMIFVPTSRMPLVLQTVSTFFGILSTLTYTFTLYQTTK